MTPRHWGTLLSGTGVPLQKGPGTSHWGTHLEPVTGVPPRKNMGPLEVLWDGHGVPSPRCEQADACENSTSRRTMYAGGKYLLYYQLSPTLHWSGIS